MPGEAVSGFVNIETNSPFDNEGASFAFDAGLGEQELGGGDVNQLSLRGSFSNDNFGILGFYSENSREQVTDNREYDLSREGSALVVNELDYRSYFIKRSDEAYGFNAEYRGDGAVSRVFLNSVYSEFTDEEERNQYVFEFLAPTAGETGTNAPLQLTRALEDGIYENSTSTNTLGIEFTAAEFDVVASYTLTETEFLQNLPITYQVAGFAGLTADGPVPYFGDFDVTNITDPILH